VVRLLTPSASRVVQLEVPKEIVRHFEVGSNGEDFVNEILHADDSELAQSLLDDFVRKGASSSLQLSVSALVDEFADGLEVGIAPGDVRIGDSQHTQRRLVQLNKSGVVDLTESKQLQNLSDSGVEAVDTPYPHDDGELRFRRDVEVAVFAGVARQAQFVRLRLPILLHVLLSALEDGGAFGLRILLFEERRFDLFGAEFRPRFALLQESLGDCGEFCRLDIRHFIN